MWGLNFVRAPLHKDSGIAARSAAIVVQSLQDERGKWSDKGVKSRSLGILVLAFQEEKQRLISLFFYNCRLEQWIGECTPQKLYSFVVFILPNIQLWWNFTTFVL